MSHRRNFLVLVVLLLSSAFAVANPGKNVAGRRAKELMLERERAWLEYQASIRPRQELIPPSPNYVVGKVVRINEQERFVVGWLHTRYLNLSGTLITRDEQLRTTATLSVGTARNNRAVGLNIVSGTPSVGDEIVLAGVALPGAGSAGGADGSGNGNAFGTYQTTVEVSENP